MSNFQKRDGDRNIRVPKLVTFDIDTYTNLDDRLFFAIPMTAGLLAGARTHKKESELRLAGQPSSEHSAVHTSKGVYDIGSDAERST